MPGGARPYRCYAHQRSTVAYQRVDTLGIAFAVTLVSPPCRGTAAPISSMPCRRQCSRILANAALPLPCLAPLVSAPLYRCPSVPLPAILFPCESLPCFSNPLPCYVAQIHCVALHAIPLQRHTTRRRSSPFQCVSFLRKAVALLMQACQSDTFAIHSVAERFGAIPLPCGAVRSPSIPLLRRGSRQSHSLHHPAAPT